MSEQWSKKAFSRTSCRKYYTFLVIPQMQFLHGYVFFCCCFDFVFQEDFLSNEKIGRNIYPSWIKTKKSKKKSKIKKSSKVGYSHLSCKIFLSNSFPM